MKRLITLFSLLLALGCNTNLMAQQNLERILYKTFGSENDFEGTIGNCKGQMDIAPNGGSYTQIFNNGNELSCDIRFTAFDGYHLTFNSYNSDNNRFVGKFVGTYQKGRIEGILTNDKGLKIEFHMRSVGRWDNGWGSWNW